MIYLHLIIYFNLAMSPVLAQSKKNKNNNFVSRKNPSKRVLNDKFDKKIESFIATFKAKVITVPELKEEISNMEELIILDAREKEEFNISHIKNAKYVGYKKFNLKKTLKIIGSKKKVIVYCSIGHRSGEIAEKLRTRGIHAYNLFGGIFEWSNQGNNLYDNDKNKTFRIHSYNESWGKWITKGEKIH